MTLFHILVFPGFLFLAVYAMALQFLDRKVYARLQNRRGPPWFQPAADFIKLLNGETVAARKEFAAPARPKPAAPAPAPAAQAKPAAAAPAAAPKAAAPAAPAAGGKKRMTPRYGVLVTNELFHNGNVESWKRIIESYKSKYSGLDVLIWYDNEKINDINTLFKWGKVKHGTPIMISVVGDDIKDVSKLQKYLFEGASPRFEVFLKGAVNRTLDLF